MSTTPHDMNNLEKQRQEADVLGVVSPRLMTLSWGERLLPYLFAGMETCWVDAIVVGIAGTSVSPSHEFLIPLWLPFVLIVSTAWLSNSFVRGHRRPTPTNTVAKIEWSSPAALLVIVLILGTSLFTLWSRLYASSMAFFNPSWLGSLLGDVFLLGPAAFHIAGIIVLVLYFCWRGLRLSRYVLEPGNVFTVMRLGIGVMLAVIVLRAATNAATSNTVLLLLLIPLFLVFALIAHGFAQTAFVRTTHRSGLQGSVFSQERALLGIIIAFGVVLLLVSLSVGAVASPAFLVNAQRIFEPVVVLYDWFAHILAFVLTIITVPIFWLLQVFHFRLHEVHYVVQSSQVFCKKYPHSVQCLKNSAQPTQDTAGALFLLAGRILLPILLLLMIVLIVRLLAHRRSGRVIGHIDEIHESLWSWELFVAQLKAFFHALWQRLFPQHAQTVQGVDGDDEMSNEPTARSIREVYRALLRWAADRGYPRKKNETPYEFRSRLHTRLPLTEPELSIVTEAYTAIRYGRVVPGESEVVHIQQTWLQLQQKSSNRNDEIS